MCALENRPHRRLPSRLSTPPSLRLWRRKAEISSASQLAEPCLSVFRQIAIYESEAGDVDVVLRCHYVPLCSRSVFMSLGLDVPRKPSPIRLTPLRSYRLNRYRSFCFVPFRKLPAVIYWKTRPNCLQGIWSCFFELLTLII